MVKLVQSKFGEKSLIQVCLTKEKLDNEKLLIVDELMSEAVRQALVDYIRLSHSDIFRDLLTCRSNPLPLSLEYEAIDRLERLGAMKPLPDDANLCLTE